jgi:hypothetical protein
MYCLMARDGGSEWYQSISIKIPSIFADFKIFVKEPRPSKQQKTFLSGLATPQGVLLNQGASEFLFPRLS